jgi:hypothetical protein
MREDSLRCFEENFFLQPLIWKEREEKKKKKKEAKSRVMTSILINSHIRSRSSNFNYDIRLNNFDIIL